MQDMGQTGHGQTPGWMPEPTFDSAMWRGPKAARPEDELLAGVREVDPFATVRPDLSRLNRNIQDLLGSDHPVLETVAQYFFTQEGGKKVRPAMVLLMSRALSAHAAAVEGGATAPTDTARGELLASQLRLAEITEMIHTASLLHDDVIDVADTRRGVKSVNQMFGNKLAILAGDFLLARSSVCLARLRNLDVVEVLSTVIEHLVKGEVMQMKGDANGAREFEYYLRKNYYKTGSLMANSLLATSILGGHDDELQRVAFDFGEAVGHAFQLVDDALDFEGSLESLGKPSLADLKLGFATAPVLFAQIDYPQLRSMIQRRFDTDGDVDTAASCVRSSRGIERTRELAVAYSEKAVDAAMRLHPSEERDALVRIALKVVNRKT